MKKVKLTAVLFFAAWPVSALALSPMEYFNSLVAGATTTGYQDGAFDLAEFNQPSALALDASGDRLFVADSGNNRIRVIFLNDQNRVETFAGSGKALCVDGSLLEASFNQPTQLVSLPENRLAVYENGDGRLRIIDLKTKRVSTIAKAKFGMVSSMAYWPKDNSLYLSDPVDNAVYRFDLKTEVDSVVLKQNKQVMSPGALYADTQSLYLADLVSPEIYQVEPGKTPAEVKLELAGKGKQVVALTKSDGVVYALQLGDENLVRVTPNYSPVSLASPWGFTLENNRGYFPLLEFHRTELVGFVSSLEARKFYICHQEGNSVLSVKDYQFDTYATARSANSDLSDYNYPAAKPKKTFRILIYGDSRVVTAPQMFPSTVKKEFIPESNFEGLKANILSKQLEFNLNAQAALKGVDEHFEVLTEGKPGTHAPMSVYYDVPAIAKKYDVDLVILLFAASDQTGFEDYYEKKIGPEGVPEQAYDTEYLLKPWKERVPAGAPQRFLDECLKEKHVTVVSDKTLSFASFFAMIHTGDAEILNNLREMMGLPIRLLLQKLNAIKNSNGKSPRFCFCLVPTSGAQFIEDNEIFWKQVCSDNQTSMLDLTREFHVLETGFFPVYQDCCSRHFSAYGNALIAYLLTNALPEHNWIPFKAGAPSQ